MRCAKAYSSSGSVF